MATTINLLTINPQGSGKDSIEAVICNAIALIHNQPSNLKDDHF